MHVLVGILAWILDNAPSLVGIVLPPLVQILNKDVTNEIERFWITIIVCLVVGVLLHWNQLVIGDTKAVEISLAIIFAESQITYRLYFKNSIISQKISSIFPPNTQTGE
jgi:hypothetical protein